MGLLTIAVPVQHKCDVVHVDRLTGERLINDRRQIVTNLRPHIEEGAAERLRVLGPEDLGVGVIVEKGSLTPPGDEHRLLGRKKNAHQRAQSFRPRLGCA